MLGTGTPPLLMLLLQLPDDIVVHILSYLSSKNICDAALSFRDASTLAEAAVRASALRRGWKIHSGTHVPGTSAASQLGTLEQHELRAVNAIEALKHATWLQRSAPPSHRIFTEEMSAHFDVLYDTCIAQVFDVHKEEMAHIAVEWLRGSGAYSHLLSYALHILNRLKMPPAWLSEHVLPEVVQYLHHDNVHARKLALKLLLRISLSTNRGDHAAKLVEQCCMCAASLVGQPERRLLPPLPSSFWSSLDDDPPQARSQACIGAPGWWPASFMWVISAPRWLWKLVFG